MKRFSVRVVDGILVFWVKRLLADIQFGPTMKQRQKVDSNSGWTLVEVLVVVAIIGLLSALAILSYAHFTKKARGAEADVALAEVTRLEELYFSATGTYTSDLEAIGYKGNPPLQYYRVSVQAMNGPDGNMFQAIADPIDGVETDQSRTVTRYANNKKPADGSAAAGNLGAASGMTSTVTSTGSAGGSQLPAEGSSDEGVEKATGSSQARNERRVVEHGKPTGGGATFK